jgi:predicted ArsR family transcriptional regulator
MSLTAAKAELPLDRDVFLRRLVRELAGSLQEVVGVDEASGYISLVGAAMGEHIDQAYRSALQVERLSREQVAEVLVDLKRRIQGDFYVLEETEDHITLGNRRCPFGEFVKERPSLCMMTSNVFGYIAAQNLGYAGIELKETIAHGHQTCTVVVHLKPTSGGDPALREYFATDEQSAA